MDTRLFSTLHQTMTWDEYCKTSKLTKTRIPLFFPSWISFGLTKADEGWIVFWIRGPMRSSSNLQHFGCQRALGTLCCCELLVPGEGQQREGDPRAQHRHRLGRRSLCGPCRATAPVSVRGQKSSVGEPLGTAVTWVRTNCGARVSVSWAIDWIPAVESLNHNAFLSWLTRIETTSANTSRNKAFLGLLQWLQLCKYVSNSFEYNAISIKDVLLSLKGLVAS